MIIECPHCYRKVVAKTDGTCPSCQADTKATAVTDQTKTLVTLSSRQKLPPICFHCGRSAIQEQRFIRTQKNRDSDQEPLVLIGIFESLFVHLFSQFFSERKRVIRLDLPVCEQHRKEKIPLKYLDFENYRASFVSSKKFREALKTLPLN